MIFVAVAVRWRQYLEQAVKISGDNSFVGVKYDSDDDSGFYDINSMEAMTIYPPYRLDTWSIKVQYDSCASVYYQWMPKKQA